MPEHLLAEADVGAAREHQRRCGLAGDVAGSRPSGAFSLVIARLTMSVTWFECEGQAIRAAE
jgi:hypothetical protein